MHYCERDSTVQGETGQGNATHNTISTKYGKGEAKQNKTMVIHFGYFIDKIPARNSTTKNLCAMDILRKTTTYSEPSYWFRFRLHCLPCNVTGIFP